MNENTEVVDYNNKNLYLKLDLAIKFGKILHITNIPKNIDYRIYLSAA